jgi:hypothetical protein
LLRKIKSIYATSRAGDVAEKKFSFLIHLTVQVLFLSNVLSHTPSFGENVAEKKGLV